MIGKKRMVLAGGAMLLSFLCLFAALNPVHAIKPRADTKTSFIYDTDVNAANSFKDLLATMNYTVDLIRINAITSTTFAGYGLIIVGNDTGGMAGNTWGDSSSRQAVNASNAKIIGIKVGCTLFDYICKYIGWGSASTDDLDSVNISSAGLPIFSTPYAFTTDVKYQLYNVLNDSMMGYIPSFPTYVQAYGLKSTLANRTTIYAESSRYYVWGYPCPPSRMTETGKHAFLDLVKYLNPNGATVSNSTPVSNPTLASDYSGVVLVIILCTIGALVVVGIFEVRSLVKKGIVSFKKKRD